MSYNNNNNYKGYRGGYADQAPRNEYGYRKDNRYNNQRNDGQAPSRPYGNRPVRQDQNGYGYQPRDNGGYNPNRGYGRPQQPQGGYNNRFQGGPGKRPMGNGYAGAQGGFGRPQGNRFNAGPGRRPAGFKPARPKVPNAVALKRQASKIAREARLAATYEALHRDFPNVFDYANIKPLLVDVHAKLFEHYDSANASTESPVKKSAIRNFLSRYIRSNEYNIAAVNHKKRYDLEGNATVDLTEEELAYHQSNIKVRRPARPKRPAMRPQGRMQQKPRFQVDRFGQRPTRAPYGQQGGFERRPFNGQAPQGGFNFRKPAIEIGTLVECNGKRGYVKEIVDDKVRVTLVDSKFVVVFPLNQVQVVK